MKHDFVSSIMLIVCILTTACTATPRDQGFPMNEFSHGKVVLGESAYVSIAENITIVDEDGNTISRNDVHSGQIIYIFKTDHTKTSVFAIIQGDESITSFEIAKKDGPERCPDWIEDFKQCDIQRFTFEGDRKK